ncbi:hypothetical protein [Marinomonas sp.]|uniref:hypothetical protein n=1 Tax=Marinomonas sp. TaxID=1904862 RepID=UPI003BAAA919
MRYFKKADGHVAAFDDDQMTSAELVDVITAENSAIELTTQYVELLSANDDLSSIDDMESEQYKRAMQRVNEAEAAYKSCDEYVSLQRLKNTKIWIPDDAVEMTEAEIEAHINPSKTVDDQKVLANSECSKRINTHWNQIGQINASLGVYGEEGKAACAAWISSNRAALVALLAREDLLEIDVIDDQYWPVFEGSN